MMRRRGASMRPVNRIKHVVDSFAALAGAAQVDVVVAGATDTPTLAVTTSVETGSVINGIYLKVECESNETILGAIPNVYMIVTKNPGGNITIPSANAVGSDDNKRFVIHQEMVLLNNFQGGNSRILFNGVIAIPKGYRRFGPNDQLVVTIKAAAMDIHFCLQAHYKEFR